MRKLRLEEFPTEDRITVRLRHGDRGRLREVAESHGMTVSGLLRDAAEIVLDAMAEEHSAASPSR